MKNSKIKEKKNEGKEKRKKKKVEGRKKDKIKNIEEREVGGERQKMK